MKMMRTEKLLILVAVTLILFTITITDIFLRTDVHGERDVAQSQLYDYYKQIIENLHRNVSVKSFGGNVYLFELVPLRIYKGLIVVESDILAIHFGMVLGDYVHLLIRKFENVTDPFVLLLARSECPDKLLSLLSTRSFRALCVNITFPFIVVYAPREASGGSRRR